MSTKQYVDVERTLNQLTDTEISPANIEAVNRFINHCAAEGISEVQQQRYVQAWKSLLTRFAPDGFQIQEAGEDELKQIVASLNRSEYAESTKHKMRCAIKKLYKIENGGDHPDKVDFFSVHKSRKPTSVTREDLFTEDELKQLFRSFTSVRDRALVKVLYESAARPGELLSRSIADFTSNQDGDFIYLEGSKGTPDRTNQLVRAGRTVREWLAQHPLGGELGDIEDPSAPLWVKSEQQTCLHCGEIPRHHDDESCTYEPDLRDGLNYGSFYQRFKKACRTANIPENKRRPYNLRHTRLTEVATFMGYEQLNKFAGWKPGSDRAKVYVHLNNDDVNQAIRDEYGLTSTSDDKDEAVCPFCDTTNQPGHSECRNCGRPLNLEQQAKQEEKLELIERIRDLEEQGMLDRLEEIDP